MKDKAPDGAAKFNSCDDGAAVNGSSDISTAVNGSGNLLGDIKERIRSAQYAALRAVNRELIGLYWDIGRMIVERQAREKWGRRSLTDWRETFRRSSPA